MPQQELDASQIDPRFQSVRGERVPEHVRVDDLGELRGLPGVAADKIHGFRRHGAGLWGTGKEPGLRLVLLPILP